MPRLPPQMFPVNSLDHLNRVECTEREAERRCHPGVGKRVKGIKFPFLEVVLGPRCLPF